ncbi:MAG: sigma-70 family RNA polymerase sigma factor [Nitrospinae bacterium]|nr:sigma-70 family RNA polymerase sigma factor [Nitrospinota bacterium]
MSDDKMPGQGKIKREDIESWFEEHGDGLYRFALLRVSDSTLAEDLVQETFLAAFKSTDSYKGQAPIRSWLLGIMKHKIADHFRKEGHLKEVKKDYESELDIKEHFGMFCWTKGYGPKNWGNDPQESHLSNKFLSVVETCLKKLIPQQRDVFVLREIEEYKTNEIEGILGRTSNSIRVTLYRARVLLRACIEKFWLKDSQRGRINDLL